MDVPAAHDHKKLECTHSRTIRELKERLLCKFISYLGEAEV